MSTFHPAYFETRFYIEKPQRELLDPAIILSAFATTGQRWPEQANRTADEALQRLLANLPHRELTRLIGYSPYDGHGEPSWHLDCDLSTGCRIGREFYQDALYVVEQGELYVVLCNVPEHRAHVGRLSERLDWLEPESMSQSLDRY